MIYGERRLPLPSNEELAVPKLREVVAEVELLLARRISADEWNAL